MTPLEAEMARRIAAMPPAHRLDFKRKTEFGWHYGYTNVRTGCGVDAHSPEFEFPDCVYIGDAFVDRAELLRALVGETSVSGNEE